MGYTLSGENSNILMRIEENEDRKEELDELFYDVSMVIDQAFANLPKHEQQYMMQLLEEYAINYVKD